MIDTLEHPVSDCHRNSVMESHTTLQQSVDSLSSEQPFVSFDLGLTENEVEFLNQLEICRETETSGKCENPDKFCVANTIASAIKCPDSSWIQVEEISTNTAKIIYKVVDNVLQQLPKYELKGFDTRVKNQWHTTPINWHKDGPEEIRIVFTLKGPSTLFCLPSALFCPPTYLWNVLEYINLLSVISNEFKDSPGQGYAFLANEAIHSPPPTKEARIFVRMMLREKDKNIT